MPNCMLGPHRTGFPRLQCDTGIASSAVIKDRGWRGCSASWGTGRFGKEPRQTAPAGLGAWERPESGLKATNMTTQQGHPIDEAKAGVMEIISGWHYAPSTRAVGRRDWNAPRHWSLMGKQRQGQVPPEAERLPSSRWIINLGDGAG